MKNVSELPTLTYRHVRADVIDMYKMTHGVYDQKITPYIKLDNQNNYELRGHKYKLSKNRA